MLAMIGQSVIMRIPHSHSTPLIKFINYTVRRYRGYSSFWQQRCHYGEKAEVPATLAKEILMDKLQLCDQWMLCQYCSHIYKEDREVLKHTQGAWISFSVSNWKKALDKMKAHEASAWHKMAKAKIEAEKQSQAEGSVILQPKQGKERCNEQTKQQNRILIKKLLRIMYFLCKQKIAHFSNFDEVVQLMVENGDDAVRKHLDTAPRNANYGSHIAISEYLDAISLWVQQGSLRSLIKKLHSIQYWLMSRQI